MDLSVVLEEIGFPLPSILPVLGAPGILFLENWVAAALAPAIAATRLGGFSSAEALGQLGREASEPGFRENRSRGSGRGKVTGCGALTEVRPLTAASYIYVHNEIIFEGSINMEEHKGNYSS